MADALEVTEVTVDPNTDNLEEFENLLSGKAKALQEAPDKEDPKTPVDDTDAVDTEDDLEEENDDSEDKDSEEETPKPKKVSRYQERINELTAKARESERALIALQAAQKQLETTQTPKPVVAEVPDKGVDPDAKNADGSEKYPLGQFDPEYIRDMARHTIDKEWAVRKEQDAQETAQRQNQEARDHIQAGWVEKLAPVTEQHEDFIDKTMGLESAFDGLDPQYSDYLVQTIKSLEHGPEVLYYFANNLDAAKEFVRSGPLGATLALGEINAMFKGTSRKVDTKVSKAPPPPQVNKGTNARKVVAADTDDLDAFSEVLFKRK